MSLEAELKELNVNVKALTAALLAGGAVAAPGKAAGAPAAPQKPAGLDYERDVKPLALKVAKEKGRETLVKINETFKVENAGKLKPEQWADYMKACTDALAPDLA